MADSDTQKIEKELPLTVRAINKTGEIIAWSGGMVLFYQAMVWLQSGEWVSWDILAMLKWIGFEELFGLFLETFPWLSNPGSGYGLHSIVTIVIGLIFWLLSVFPFSLFLIIVGIWMVLYEPSI